MKLRLFLSLLAICAYFVVFAQTADSTKSIPESDDEFNLFLLLFGLAALSLMLGMFMISLAVALICISIFLGLMLLGVLSASFLIGFYQKSFTGGLKSSIIIAATLFSSLVGMLLFTLAANIFKIEVANSTSLIVGFIMGGLGGFMAGKIIIKLFSLFIGMISKRRS